MELNKESKVMELYHEFMDNGDNTFAYGSCQYQSAVAAVYIYKNMQHLTVKEIASELGFNLEPGEIQSNYLEKLREQLLAEGRDRIENWGYTGEEDRYITPVENMTTAEDAFEITKSWSWDLWGAAPFVASITLNASINSKYTSVETGLLCARLMEAGIIKDEECFNGFDT